MIIRFAWFAIMALFLFAWIRTLVQIIQTPDHMYRAGSQVLWAVVVILLPFIGLVLYYAIGAPDRS
jgi:hypothetical protein